MKYLEVKEKSERERILLEFGLTLNPSVEELSQGVSKYVYEKCEFSIPSKIKGIFKYIHKLNLNSKERSVPEDELFRDIEIHLELNTHMLRILNSSEERLKGITTKMEALRNSLSYRIGEFPQAPERDWMKPLIKICEEDFEVEVIRKQNSSSRNQIYAPNSTSFFFIFLSAFYNNYRRYKQLDIDKSFIGLVTCFIEIMKEFPIDQQIISKYLFERTFKVNLIKQIRTVLDSAASTKKESGEVSISKSEENGDPQIQDRLSFYIDFYSNEGRSLLSLATLLPNIHSRGKFVDYINQTILSGVYTKIVPEYTYGWYGSSSIFNSSENMYKEIRKMILELSVIAFPLMELYHYHLSEMGFSDENKQSKYSPALAEFNLSVPDIDKTAIAIMGDISNIEKMVSQIKDSEVVEDLDKIDHYDELARFLLEPQSTRDLWRSRVDELLDKLK
ncbi:hypothetical protein [Paenibacillus physcomitrellae]|uniref:Uncharacterized protein n=1 Tax=Paenibacillus physcomitrellae TaxID=1619311 RepID=A0ABQ1GSP2_9BACL|nr:hypothetical protein [Paenibacillus physcomitrellae]GGA49291.1 hypothetical protein GCM10010917_38200 [Paenibacillus physcomitrellae]